MTVSAMLTLLHCGSYLVFHSPSMSRVAGGALCAPELAPWLFLQQKEPNSHQKWRKGQWPLLLSSSDVIVQTEMTMTLKEASQVYSELYVHFKSVCYLSSIGAALDCLNIAAVDHCGE